MEGVNWVYEDHFFFFVDSELTISGWKKNVLVDLNMHAWYSGNCCGSRQFEAPTDVPRKQNLAIGTVGIVVVPGNSRHQPTCRGNKIWQLVQWELLWLPAIRGTNRCAEEAKFGNWYSGNCCGSQQFEAPTDVPRKQNLAIGTVGIVVAPGNSRHQPMCRGNKIWQLVQWEFVVAHGNSRHQPMCRGNKMWQLVQWELLWLTAIRGTNRCAEETKCGNWYSGNCCGSRQFAAPTDVPRNKLGN